LLSKPVMDLSKPPPAGHYRQYSFYAFDPSPPRPLAIKSTRGETEQVSRPASSGAYADREQANEGTVKRGVMKFEALAAMNSATSTGPPERGAGSAKRRRLEPPSPSASRRPRNRDRARTRPELAAQSSSQATRTITSPSRRACTTPYNHFTLRPEAPITSADSRSG